MRSFVIFGWEGAIAHHVIIRAQITPLAAAIVRTVSLHSGSVMGVLHRWRMQHLDGDLQQQQSEHFKEVRTWAFVHVRFYIPLQVNRNGSKSDGELQVIVNRSGDVHGLRNASL